MAASNLEDTLVFLEAHPQLASKHLKPLQMSTNSAKQALMLDFFLVIYCVIIVENK